MNIHVNDESVIQQRITKATTCATQSLGELASAAGMSVDTLSSWRRGTRTPTPGLLKDLAHAIQRQSQQLETYAEELFKYAVELESPAGRAIALLPAHEYYQRSVSGQMSLASTLAKRIAENPMLNPEKEARRLLREERRQELEQEARHAQITRLRFDGSAVMLVSTSRLREHTVNITPWEQLLSADPDSREDYKLIQNGRAVHWRRIGFVLTLSEMLGLKLS